MASHGFLSHTHTEWTGTQFAVAVGTTPGVDVAVRVGVAVRVAAGTVGVREGVGTAVDPLGVAVILFKTVANVKFTKGAGTLLNTLLLMSTLEGAQVNSAM